MAGGICQRADHSARARDGRNVGRGSAGHGPRENVDDGDEYRGLSKSPEGTAYWIVAGKKSAKLDKLIYRILSVAVEQQLTLGDIIGAFKPEMRERLLAYFRDPGANGSLTLNDPLRPMSATRESATASGEAPLEAPQASATEARV
jgi:hypothetical protein